MKSSYHHLLVSTVIAALGILLFGFDTTVISRNAEPIQQYDKNVFAENLHQLAESHPNIVLIMADDMGAFAFGCYGNPRAVKTPNIDQLTESGIQHING